MNRGDHIEYLHRLLDALVTLGEQRVAQAEWIRQQDGLPDREEQARTCDRSGRELVEYASWALNSQNQAIFDDTARYGNGCRFRDGTTIIIHRPVHPMRGPQRMSWLYTVVTRPTREREEAPADLWIPFTLPPHDFASHARILAPWVADVIQRAG
jgi:hypothetical protein